MKKILLFVLASMFAVSAFAGATGGCVGTYKGKKIVFNGKMSDVNNKDSAEGSLAVDGRIVADFEGEQLKINLFFQTFKVVNYRGALVEGRATNVFSKKGVISRLYVPEFGIDYRNIPMACWTRH